MHDFIILHLPQPTVTSLYSRYCRRVNIHPIKLQWFANCWHRDSHDKVKSILLSNRYFAIHTALPQSTSLFHKLRRITKKKLVYRNYLKVLFKYDLFQRRIFKDYRFFQDLSEKFETIIFKCLQLHCIYDYNWPDYVRVISHLVIKTPVDF